MANATQLRTIKQLAEELRPTGLFGESALRWLIFNSATNGFDACIVRIGRRILIDRDAFGQWVDRKRSGKAA